jgi:aryl-alcohol dehydrogenase-like predicted oxidoreductase
MTTSRERARPGGAMERRRLGRTDIEASILGFGGSEIGYEGASLSTVNKLLNEALDAGLNVIDTAECYVASEELIGKTIGKRRDEYYLFTKVGHEGGWSYPDWRPESLLRSQERSLKRLKTDYVDLIQLHSCSEAELRKGHVIDALRRARERGYARYNRAPSTHCKHRSTSPTRKQLNSIYRWRRSAIWG